MDNRIHIVIQIDDKTIYDYYNNKDQFRTRGFAALKAAEIYPYIREQTLQSIKGIFTFEELELLAKILSIENFVKSKEILIEEINASSQLQSSSIKETVRGIVGKIEKMDFYQALVFTEWLSTYKSFSESYRGKGKGRKINFKKYAESLL